MKVGGELGRITGTGIFEPLGGTLEFSTDYEKNSVDLIACQKNFGQQTAGILMLEKVRNQGYKHDLESFKIYMTVERDTEFISIYQQVIEGFEVKESQQKAGRMLGTIDASSFLVQTYASFSIELQPSMNLKESSYILIDVPESLEF